jgi:hypothetical protein
MIGAILGILFIIPLIIFLWVGVIITIKEYFFD